MSSEFYSKYAVKNKIGEGTFSDVLKCQIYSSGQEFAVKRLKKQYNRLSEALDLPELIILQKLPSHPNVLSLFEFTFDPLEGKLYLVFELMEMSLYELIQSRRRCLPETRVKLMFYQILKGLEHLHSHGIFHRDIKPENILVKKTSVKLADLGSIRGVHSQLPYTEYISTRWYRAPECILTEGYYGPKVDVWASGCVYFEMLTSKPIFPGANEIDQLTKIHQIIGTPNPRVMLKLRRTKSRVGDIKFAAYPSTNLTVLLPFTSDGGREILKRMLTYDPEVRTNVRRLLEHRYFNDLREPICHSKSFSYPLKQWSCPGLRDYAESCNKQTRSKQKPESLGITAKKSTKPKLTTSSWAPSSNNSKMPLFQSKSKDSNIQATNVKKRPGPPTSKIKTKIDLAEKPTLIPVKQTRIIAKTMGDLPSLLKIASKGQSSGVDFRTYKNVLPPILEH